MKRVAAALIIILAVPLAGGALSDLLLSPQARHNASWFWFAFAYFYWKGLWILLFLGLPFCAVAKALHWTQWWVYIAAGLILGMVEPLARLAKYRAAPWLITDLSAPEALQRTFWEVLAWTTAALVFWHITVRVKQEPNPSIERTRPGKPGRASHVKR
ncbi:hypothetical protein [Rivibacter subsaxonicus]|uniref:hypothetical protein n=1 Tax=Rivibacter subsaxonicus TaxID=457575 RepID=UPI00102B2B5B|nr:hypothetical protein [Rivibacter subsaxonicus]